MTDRGGRAGARPLRAAVLYLRISQDPTGEELGMERQQELAEQMADARGWKIIETINEDDTSAAGKVQRGGFDRVLALLESGAAEVVIGRDWTRLTRNRRDRLRLIEVGQKVKATVGLLRGSDIDMGTATGRMTADILASVAEGEIAMMAERRQDANRQRAKKGRPPLGVRLTGYTTKGELVPDEAAVVKLIFDEFVRTGRLRSICRLLDERGVPTRSAVKKAALLEAAAAESNPKIAATWREKADKITVRQWHPTSVREILTNPRYYGGVVYQGEVVADAEAVWEPIVDRETFQTVQSILSSPSRRTAHSTEPKHLGSGVYLCGMCGRKIRAHGSMSKGGVKRTRYRCPNACVNRSMDQIDSLVIGLVEKRLARPDVKDLLPDTDDTEGRELQAEWDRLQGRLKAAWADYQAGHLDGSEYREFKTELRSALARVEQRQTERVLAGIEDGILSAKDPVRAFEAAGLADRQRTIRSLMTVELLPAPKGRKTFDPATVKITWTTT